MKYIDMLKNLVIVNLVSGSFLYSSTGIYTLRMVVSFSYLLNLYFIIYCHMSHA